MRNLTLLTDYYELTMMYGYMKNGLDKRTAVFDIFYRPLDEFNYAVACGLEQAIEYVNGISFGEEEIAYLESLGCFDKEFLDRLRDFKFSGDIYAVPEGTVVFPHEPIMTVKAPLFEAQFLETALLNILNHQTLIASKASRIAHAAEDKMVVEFGLRRAQGPDAGIYGARAAIIGGCSGTSNVLTGQMFGADLKGTHAHSWIMSFPDELTAFRRYAELFPHSTTLLVDTYDTLKSGVPNAIKVFDEMKAKGLKPIAIRLDSGDLAYLSKRARAMLDEAGHSDVKIMASGDMDEHVLTSLHLQGAKIDTYGIGTKLITSYSNPSLGGVYKLAALEDEEGVLRSKIKISNALVKVTNPGFKTVWRIFDHTGHAAADLIALRDEKYDESEPLTVFHPLEPWKKTTFTDYTMRELTVPVILGGETVYEFPTLSEVAAYAKDRVNEFWDEYKRIVNPHIYKVDLSKPLYDLKQQILSEAHK